MPDAPPVPLASVASAPSAASPARALQWLARREYSRAELRRKLLAHAQRAERDERQRRAVVTLVGDTVNEAGVNRGNVPAKCDPNPAARAAAIETLLDWLESHRYLCDERFVESRVHARVDRFGNARIRLELAQHRVALSPDAERRLRETEFERARALWLRRYAGASINPSSRARQSRFLAGRGFGAEVIARVLREAARAAHGAGGQPDDD